LGTNVCERHKADLAAATQAAIVEVLVKKSLRALRETGLPRLVVAGGVGANRELRRQLDVACAKRGVRVHYPELDLCTDNGAMIALAGLAALKRADPAEVGRRLGYAVHPRWSLAEATA
jgi:N6-L-threonylcarbamoyladenine synthase